MDENFMQSKPVLPLLLSMALPMVISMLVNSLYNIIDSFFVAQISEDAMTALSLVYPVQNFINSIAIGFGVGINALIALFLGAKDNKNANNSAALGFILSLIHGVIITFVSIIIMPGFLSLFTNSSDVIDLGLKYSVIAFSFSIVIMANLAFEKVFQAVGKMKVTMIGLLGGCVTNIILDPLLIFGIGFFPKLEIKGAAPATGLGQCVTLLIYIAVYFIKPITVKINFKDISFSPKLILKLYTICIPAILNLALPSFLVSFLNGILSTLSQSYVVILGIYYKLQTFLYLPANGIIQGMRPVIGYNYGAEEHTRVKKIYHTTLYMNFVIMLIGTIITLIFAQQLMMLFTTNNQTIIYGKTALRIISLGFIASSVSVTASGALEGLGKGIQSLIISLCRYIIIIMPFSFVLCKLYGAIGVWLSFGITEVITALISFIVYKKSLKNNI